MFLSIPLLLAGQPHPPLVTIALLAPVLILIGLVAAATLVALFAGPERGIRARLVLNDLLSTLRRGGRR